MSRESKLTLANFVDQDRFELNSYLTYLFQQFYDNAPDQPDDKLIKP
ncbi:hypothetical protein [Pseudalkalibacillus decolorationis]|nr:hypothetical protein [Pseudalkalibacillus decolorationis]